MDIEPSHPSPARYRHAYLLAALILVIAVSPFLDQKVLGVAVIEAFLFVALLTGAYATAANRGRFWLSGVLAVLAVAGRIGWGVQPSEPLLYGFLACYIGFFSVVGFTLIGRLFETQERISGDALYGALSVYLILGIIWSIAYTILESAAPGSFHFGTQGALTDAPFERFLGFSFTTLTTLGYGNVSPATPQADAVSTMEAIVGQCYLAIVIARLVALQIVQGRTPPPTRD